MAPSQVAVSPRRATTLTPRGKAAVAAKHAGSASPVASFTWEEVAKHNSAESAWIYCHDKVYDITKWMDGHPGGKEVLLMSAGRYV